MFNCNNQLTEKWPCTNEICVQLHIKVTYVDLLPGILCINVTSTLGVITTKEVTCVGDDLWKTANFTLNAELFHSMPQDICEFKYGVKQIKTKEYYSLKIEYLNKTIL
jgi:hypothetical protein